MRKSLIFIPLIICLAYITILFDIPIFRKIIIFVYLSFIPGFAIFSLFKLKETSILENILFSVALSIAFVMFSALLINELYIVFSFSQPLSPISLAVAISAFTWSFFFLAYRSAVSESGSLNRSSKSKKANVLPLVTTLVFLLLLNAIGVLSLNVFLILLSSAIIAALCVASVVFRRLIPENLFPFLIFSISLVLLCQVLLTSKYVVGVDINLEYYVFRLTQINGHWGPLNANFHNSVALNYNSMLSVTLLPAVYSSLMNADGEIVFRTLYHFVICLVPLTLYRIYEKQFGKLIGLLSVFFFVFTPSAFYGETGQAKQIVGTLFYLLSILLIIDKTVSVKKRRLLLIIFGAALAVSHYSLACLYLSTVALVFIISKAKKRLNGALNMATVLVLFVVSFSWLALSHGMPFVSIINTIRAAFVQLTTGTLIHGAKTASAFFATPEVFTMATWINMILRGIAHLFLIIGIMTMIFKSKQIRAIPEYIDITVLNAIILLLALVFPSIASILNFDRLYGITLLILSPGFVFGGLIFLSAVKKVWMSIKRSVRRNILLKNKTKDGGLLLVAIIASGYFLSQVGFVNRVSGGAIHSYNTDFDLMIKSNDIHAKIMLYWVYMPDHHVFSASWLSRYRVGTTAVFADILSTSNALVSYGLIPNRLLTPITNSTFPKQGSLVYLRSLNTVNGVIVTVDGLLNTSEISYLFDQNNLVYSNGDSQIWYVTPAN